MEKIPNPDIADLVKQGYRYRRRLIAGHVYMLLRKGNIHRSMGRWSSEREASLFASYPELKSFSGMPKPPQIGETAESYIAKMKSPPTDELLKILEELSETAGMQFPSHSRVKQLADAHADWFVSTVKPLLVEFFKHGYKHGEEDALE